MTIKIPGDPDYSHSHYWRTDSPRCGLATAGGACGHPREPGTAWCNPHTFAWLDAAKRAGYASEEQLRWACEQATFDEAFTDALIRRWRRFHAPPQPVAAPQTPEAPAPAATPADTDATAPSATEAHGRRPRRLA